MALKGMTAVCFLLLLGIALCIAAMIRMGREMEKTEEWKDYYEKIAGGLIRYLTELRDLYPRYPWIRVEDGLPTEKDQLCWVWGEGFEEPEMDTWEDDRGKPGHWSNGPEETRDYVKSGWYENTGKKITHWCEVAAPAKPKEGGTPTAGLI